ncbi:ChrR family anti-sigma-E factor [Aestuariirhabdus litorea]|uniref:Transcriptional regulator n=1 Tax=Aestuariirhabdus litorea TaxID=2528527 RepID=A0A3P3VQN2_9GAMM|nr:ChrR family anti-sigma-E factor [Aestuariirhabdus litorea]RRJ83839.1 transcriptional regulator [Aestuariirhabdus litorea]RWW97062.1 transcriptional regulator [Endozoicomonadaceae bacterium GTF-13]
MIKQHPSTDLLAEYAAGCLPWAHAICVTTHIHYCGRCREQVDQLNQLGADLMEASAGASSVDLPVDHGLLDRVLGAIDTPPASEPSPTVYHRPVTGARSRADLPPIVDRLISNQGVNWKRVSSGLKVARLQAGDDNHEVALHKICAGAKVAHHDHRATEVTVVLRGSFSDEDGVYAVGDFLLREPGEPHRPMAAQNQDCLCLSAQQAPIRLTGPWRWINPFLRIQPG